MDHCVQYHNTQRMGGPPATAGCVFTDKAFKRTLRGSRVWLIVGEGSGPQKEFFLHSTFLVREVADASHPDFAVQLVGEPDAPIHSPQRIPDGFMLDGLRHATGNFGFGLTRITSHAELVEALFDLAGL